MPDGERVEVGVDGRGDRVTELLGQYAAAGQLLLPYGAARTGRRRSAHVSVGLVSRARWSFCHRLADVIAVTTHKSFAVSAWMVIVG
jgi:hypothetical protein